MGNGRAQTVGEPDVLDVLSSMLHVVRSLNGYKPGLHVAEVNYTPSITDNQYVYGSYGQSREQPHQMMDDDRLHRLSINNFEG